MSNYSREPVTVDFNGVVHETDKAFLLQVGKRQVWFPKSISEFDWKKGEVTVPTYFAEKEDLV
jgi:hypothetical protein